MIKKLKPKTTKLVAVKDNLVSIDRIALKDQFQKVVLKDLPKFKEIVSRLWL
ncbi:MAG: hypothetical protein KDC67_03125 [Ignavibacteriae bacterium]|nr:hypothetical protein [Ignavibacteriota bacterium]